MNSTQEQIIVIDDTPANLHLLSTLLKENGYLVRSFPSGKLALTFIEKFSPSLILLDIQMPNMDGYEVCQHLKANDLTADIPVIFISALDEVMDKLKAFTVGGVDYITKPFQTEEVLARISTHLELSCLQKILKQENHIQAQQLAEQNRQLQQMNQELEKANKELNEKYDELKQAQLTIIQSEKMASLGNLMAGVAHEINNPLGFLNGSLANVQENLQDIIEHLELYQKHYPEATEPIQENAEEIDLEFLCEDTPKLLNSMECATERMKNISTSLRTFSRADTEHQVSANLHEGLESTLMILKYRLKANQNRPEIEVIKDYEEFSEVKCFPGQLNQVFMNIIANAIDVFDEVAQDLSYSDLEAQPQKITIKTAQLTEENAVEIRIGDNGKGMPPEVKERIFDHLFTTKGVGKGTGLGLAIARQIVVEKHGGSLEVHSSLGQGTQFCIRLPVFKIMD